ncbi:MAG: hypothetical protein FJZ63_02630 [Chlamydiae bacterium]|nr:hypothetical protein [Chlamydiota bacterium]
MLNLFHQKALSHFYPTPISRKHTLIQIASKVDVAAIFLFKRLSPGLQYFVDNCDPAIDADSFSEQLSAVILRDMQFVD